MPTGDYIDSLKSTDGVSHPIRDTTSGYQKELIAGDNITITETVSGPVISAAGGDIPATVVSVSNHVLTITNGVPNGDGESY